jgi:PKD repeat protein
MEVKAMYGKFAVILSALFVFLLFTCGGDNGTDPEPQLPVECTDSVSANYGTLPLNVDFYATAIGGIGSYTYERTFHSNSGKFFVKDTNWTYNYPGIYTAILKVISGNSTAYDSTRIHVFSYSCSLTANQDTGVVPLEVAFTGHVPSTGSYSFIWDFGTGDSSYEQNPTYTFTNGGEFPVKFTSINTENSDTCYEYLTINVGCNDTLELACTAEASPYTVGDPPLAVNFSADAEGGCPPYDFSWDFGDGSTGNGQEVSHTFTKEGVSQVVMTVTDSQDKTCQETITVHVNPFSCNISKPVLIRAGSPATFTGSATGGTPPYYYSWEIVGVATGSGQDYEATFDLPGTYDIILTVTDNNDDVCISASDVAVTCSKLTAFAYADSAGILVDTITGKVPFNVSFVSNISGGCSPYDYRWFFSETDSVSAVNTIYEYCDVGIYNAVLRVTDTSGNEAYDTVIVNAVPIGIEVIKLGNDSTFLPGSFNYGYDTVDCNVPCQASTSTAGNMDIYLIAAVNQTANAQLKRGVEFTISRNCGSGNYQAASISFNYRYNLYRSEDCVGDEACIDIFMIIQDITNGENNINQHQILSGCGSGHSNVWSDMTYTFENVLLEHAHKYRIFILLNASAFTSSVYTYCEGIVYGGYTNYGAVIINEIKIDF